MSADAIEAARRPWFRAFWPDTRTHEFHAGSLEIVHTPPSPIGRAISWTIIAAALAALAWAWFGKVDMVVAARGRIVPDGRSKVVQAPEGAQVARIHVREDQFVRAGEPVIDLNPTEALADLARLRRELADAELEAARLDALLAAPYDPRTAVAAFAVPAAAGEPGRLQRRQLTSTAEGFAAEAAALAAQIEEKRAEATTARADLARLAATLPLMREQVEARRPLVEKGFASKLQVLDLERQLIDAEKSSAILAGRLAQSEAAIRRLMSQRRQVSAEVTRRTATDLTAARQRVAALTQELRKAEYRAARLRIAAPRAGYVQQLNVHTVGAVVTPAQPLLTIVPQGARLEVEARIANSDVGDVRVGQRVAVKVDAHDFTRFGLLEGRVRSLSREAVTPSEADPTGSLQRDAEPVYIARIALRPTAGRTGNRLSALFAGMSVTAEVKAGRRRIADYLLSPVAEHAHDSFREI